MCMSHRMFMRMTVGIFLLNIVALQPKNLHADDAKPALILNSRKDFLIADVAIDVLREAYRAINIPVIFRYRPHNRALIEVENGAADGEVARLAHVVKKHANLRLVAVPIALSEIVVFSNEPELTIKSWQEVSRHRAVGLFGNRYIESQLKGQPHMLVEDSLTLFRMVRYERMEIAVIGKLEGLMALQKSGLDQIHMHDPPLESLPEYHVLHRKHEALIPILERQLKKMESEGRIEKIWTSHLKRLY